MLTDEHIIPFALGGKIKLKNSTCESCRGITSKFETEIIKGPLSSFRFRAGITSRTGKPPKELPIFAINGNENERRMIPFEQYPAMIALPRFNGAALLNNGRINALPINPWTAIELGKAQLLMDALDIQSFATIKLNVYSFSRLIAKIAHCWALWTFGQNFSPTLTNIITKNEGDNFRKYIQSRESSQPTDINPILQHKIEISEFTVNGICFYVIHLQLFSNLGAPTYDIVVGQKDGDFCAAPALDSSDIILNQEHRIEEYRFDISREENVSAGKTIEKIFDVIIK